MVRNTWKKEYIDVLKRYGNRGRNAKDIADILNEKFGTQFTDMSIYKKGNELNYRFKMDFSVPKKSREEQKKETSLTTNKKIFELGKICIQNELSKVDLFRMKNYKKFEKEIDYLIKNHVTINDMEIAYSIKHR